MKYEVYDDDRLVCSGEPYEICAFLGIRNTCNLKNYCEKNRKLLKRYTVKFKQENRSERLKREYKEKLHYLIIHLKKYGNTILCQDPQRFIDDLLKENIIIDYQMLRKSNKRKEYYVERTN